MVGRLPPLHRARSAEDGHYACGSVYILTHYLRASLRHRANYLDHVPRYGS